MKSTATLAEAQLIWLQLQGGDTLSCLSGCVWLSVDGQDIVLRPGQQYRAGRRQTLLCQALQPSRLSHRAGGAPRQQPERKRPALALLQFWRPQP